MFEFRTKGNPRERGFQHGDAVKDYCSLWLSNLQEVFIQQVEGASLKEGLDRKQARLDAICRQWQAVDKDSFQEIQGIAAGLGMDEQLYLTLLCMNATRLMKCTVLAFRDSAGFPVIGKTDDILEQEIGQNVVEIAEPHNGYAYISFGFAATVCTFSGMNEHGLAAALTGIPGPSLVQDGMPSCIGARGVLQQCRSVSEATDYIKDMKINYYGFSATLGDAGGELAQVEKNGIGFASLNVTEGECCVHTNDILDVSLSSDSPQQPEPLRSNSHRRYDSTLRWLEDNNRNSDSMFSFLSARDGCDHIIQTGQDGLFTDYRVVFLPGEKRLLYLCGYESDRAEEITVDAILNS